MPTYEYVCEACGHELEIFQSITESAKRKCPKCAQSKLKRKIGAGAGILFKGSGFYQTDYRSDSYKKSADADKPSAPKEPGKDSAKDSSSKTESKPDKPAADKSASKSDKKKSDKSG